MCAEGGGVFAFMLHSGNAMCNPVSKTHFCCQAWLRMPLIPALQKQRQEYICEFKAYIMSFRTSRAMQKPCLKRHIKEKKIMLFGFCQAVAKMANVSTCTCVGGGEKSIACPLVGSESHECGS